MQFKKKYRFMYNFPDAISCYNLNNQVKVERSSFSSIGLCIKNRLGIHYKLSGMMRM